MQSQGLVEFRVTDLGWDSGEKFHAGFRGASLGFSVLSKYCIDVTSLVSLSVVTLVITPPMMS